MLLCALAPAAQGARSWHEPIQISSDGARVTFANIDQAGNDGAVAALWHEDQTGDLRAAFKERDSDDVSEQTLGQSWWADSALKTSPTGETVAAWVSWPDSRVMVADLDPQAGRFGDPADMGPAQDASAPALAANADGDYVLAFVRETDEGAAIWAMRRPHGESWTDPRRIGSVERESDWKRSLEVALARNGDAVFVWADELGENDQRVRAVTESADGEVGAVQELSTGGHKAWNPHIAMDALGQVVAAWVETPPDTYEGPVRASVSLPNGLFRPAVDLLGNAGDWDDVAVGTGTAGNAIVAWRNARFPELRIASGALATGVFLPALLLPNDAFRTEPTLATDSDGNAVIVNQGWWSRELKVIRRSRLGIPGQPRNVSCPAPTDGIPVAATVDASGNASFVWREVAQTAFHSLFLAQDEPSGAFSPDPCPPRRPSLDWAPHEPDPGDTVTFDGSGTADWSGAKEFRYEWDFDDDGTFEVDNGSDPIAQHVFDDEGLHRIRYRVTEIPHDPDEPVSSEICVYEVRVGLPHLDLPVEDPYAWDRRPLDLPNEDPWPLDPPVDVPPVDDPPVDVPPVDPPHEGDVPPADVPPVEVPPIVVAPPETQPTEPPPQFVGPGVDVDEATEHLIGPTAPPPTLTPGLTVRIPAKMRRGVALRRGLPLTLSSGQSLTVRVRALVRRRGVLAPAARLLTRVTPLRPLTARVRLPRWARTSLAQRRHASVRIEIGAVSSDGGTQVVRRGVQLIP